MSAVTEIARAILALAQPLTGDRASGTVTIAAESEPTFLPRASYLLPVLRGEIRPELAVKVDTGPDDDQDGVLVNGWRVEPSGTVVDIVSNVGGERHNFPPGTPLVFDPPVAGLSRRVFVDDPGLTGATAPAAFGGIKSAVTYETFAGPQANLDLFRAAIGGVPAILVVWQNSEPADGTTIPQTSRPTRVGTNSQLYKEQFDLVVISSRDDKDHIRREEGMRILDDLTALLTDRHEVDGVCFSNPSGLQIRQRFREQGPQPLYQDFYVYVLALSAMRAYHRRDVRTYNDWLTTHMILTTPDNELPNQGPLTVADVEFEMIQDAYDDGYSEGYA